jgi:hypothetical protein
MFFSTFAFVAGPYGDVWRIDFVTHFLDVNSTQLNIIIIIIIIIIIRVS